MSSEHEPTGSSTSSPSPASSDLLHRLRQALEEEQSAEHTLAEARKKVRELLTQARAAGIRYNTIARCLIPPGDPFESMRARRAMVGRLRQRFWMARKKHAPA